MGLDIALELEEPIAKKTTGHFITLGNTVKELESKEEILKYYPDMDVSNVVEYEELSKVVFVTGLPHTLRSLAWEVKLYEALWRPHMLYTEEDFNTKEEEEAFEDSLDIRAESLINVLQNGLNLLREREKEVRPFAPKIGVGTYEQLVETVASYLEACQKYPFARVIITR